MIKVAMRFAGDHFVLMLLAVTLSACSPGGTAPASKNAYMPIGAAELRGLLSGHYMRDCDGPLDSGPLILRDDDTFEKVTGFGNYGGSYEVRDSLVVFRGTQDGLPVAFKIRFFRNAAGSLLWSDEGNPPRSLDLRKIDEHSHDLSCK
ncbi:hypothetical protein MZO42_13320 [Sphingomonas psychrotolerans]|uniref:Lipoprotein n=1 Tax=Sphingomonas psychrotolerans TaxID=1327635 RepID=A0ABU3N8I8_9SPHN|nr:hypothetical protein [Sphingomonas psychrotolerans]MDT8759680.1 hypothetical protein [Sphingomonas psychrotolerans]